MLAMVANDDAGNLTPCGVLRFIASRLAPTSYTGEIVASTPIKIVTSRKPPRKIAILPIRPPTH